MGIAIDERWEYWTPDPEIEEIRGEEVYQSSREETPLLRGSIRRRRPIEEDKSRCKEDYLKNKPIRSIARELRRSPNTISAWIKEMGLARPKIGRPPTESNRRKYKRRRMNKFKRMYLEGVSYWRMAVKLRASELTLRSWRKILNLPLRKGV